MQREKHEKRVVVVGPFSNPHYQSPGLHEVVQWRPTGLRDESWPLPICCNDKHEAKTIFEILHCFISQEHSQCTREELFKQLSWDPEVVELRNWLDAVPQCYWVVKRGGDYGVYFRLPGTYPEKCLAIRMEVLTLNPKDAAPPPSQDPEPTASIVPIRRDLSHWARYYLDTHGFGENDIQVITDMLKRVNGRDEYSSDLEIHPRISNLLLRLTRNA
ncbi:hypothetical protein VKT23_016664 [Stygiomarasmius scandens]|uniref:Uncharacterized protein n=1 Tax=Marasmiellus scandens TaxID=2682957 RepID=A0ABR1IU41_9AGAR